jgi:hypothetical protein
MARFGASQKAAEPTGSNVPFGDCFVSFFSRLVVRHRLDVGYSVCHKFARDQLCSFTGGSPPLFGQAVPHA